VHEEAPCRLDYTIACDDEWRTRAARVTGWIGDRAIESLIHVSDDGLWRLNGQDQPQLAGCTDVDLNFSPSTNLLPVRRLKLTVGQEAPVIAAWL
jgi:hypothetical protein